MSAKNTKLRSMDADGSLNTAYNSWENQWSLATDPKRHLVKGGLLLGQHTALVKAPNRCYYSRPVRDWRALNFRVLGFLLQ